MPSFDVVLEPNLVEVRNAVEQSNKDIGARFDFKGSSAHVEWADKGAADRSITLLADSEFQIGQVRDIVNAKLAKRSVDARFLDDSAKIEAIGGDKARHRIVVKSGVPSDLGKKIQGVVKQSKLKVQAAIQGDSVRVTGAKRDELQAVIALLKRECADQPLSFSNFRD